MTEIEIVMAGFNYLNEDCSRVLLAGWEHSETLPEAATKKVIDNGLFDHSFDDINNDAFDEAEFWGNIYLPFGDGTYMKFEVGA